MFGLRIDMETGDVYVALAYRQNGTRRPPAPLEEVPPALGHPSREDARWLAASIFDARAATAPW
jgi:hypothetical protein